MRVLGGRPGGVTSLHLDDGTEERARLVVVGNGMAGARFVEEVLERGGGDQFRITVFGEEPHGNYNRIMLSPVLAGAQLTWMSEPSRRQWPCRDTVGARSTAEATVCPRAAVAVNDADARSCRPIPAESTSTASSSPAPRTTRRPRRVSRTGVRGGPAGAGCARGSGVGSLRPRRRWRSPCRRPRCAPMRGSGRSTSTRRC